MTKPGAAAERQDPVGATGLEAADRALDAAVALVARELRAPLRSILKLGRQIREYDGEMDAGAREYAEHIRASAEHMSVMLASLRRPCCARRRTTPAGRPGEPGASP